MFCIIACIKSCHTINDERSHSDSFHIKLYSNNQMTVKVELQRTCDLTQETSIKIKKLEYVYLKYVRMFASQQTSKVVIRQMTRCRAYIHFSSNLMVKIG